MLLRSYSFMLVATVFWALNPIATKSIFTEFPINQYLFYRAMLASAGLLIVLYIMGYRLHLKTTGWKPFFLGMLDPGLSSFVYCMSLSVLSASNAILVMAMMPVSQSIMGRLVFKEEFKSSMVAGAFLALAGVSIFLAGENLNGTEGIWGNFLLLIVFLIMMISQLLTRSIMKTEKPVIQVTSAQMIGATGLMGLILIFNGEMGVPPQMSNETWITFAYLVFSLAMPFLLYNVALKDMPVAMASLMLVLIIPFGFIFATTFLGEELNWTKAGGAFLVMLGVGLPHLPQVRRLALRT